MLRNVLVVAALSASVAGASIANMFFERYQKESPEKLVVRIVALKTEPSPTGLLRVIADAQVVSVNQTATGLVQGARIRIEYGTESSAQPRPSVTCSSPPIPLLRKGQTTIAFLYRRPAATWYSPAAAHQSFNSPPVR